MPGSGRPVVGQLVGLIAVVLIVLVLLIAYSAAAPIFGLPPIQ